MYFSWGAALGSQSLLKREEERETYLKEACKKFEKAVKIKPDECINYMAWGVVLRKRAELKTGKEKEQLEREAEEKFAKTQEVYDRTLKEKQNTSGDKTT